MHCLECNRAIPTRDSACSCGWVIPQRLTTGRPKSNPRHGKCAWTDSRGCGCQYPGALSQGTRGEGPFFCGFHFLCGNAIAGDEIVRQSDSWDGDMASYIEMRREAVGKARRHA